MTDEQVNSVTPTSAGLTEEPEHFRKLFIGGLSQQTTKDSLQEFYGKFGQVVDTIVVIDQATQRPRGFGFITFSTKAELDSAMDARPHIIDDKTVDPKRAVPREIHNKGNNVSTSRLFVSGVREEHTEDHFKDCFSKFGSIQKVDIALDKETGKPRGFAFVTFDDYDSVDRCVIEKSHIVNGFRCDVKKGLSRDELSRSYQMQRDRMERGNRMSFRGGRGAGPMNWQGRGGGPAGSFREPHSAYGNAPSWNVAGNVSQWGYPVPTNSQYGVSSWNGTNGGEWNAQNPGTYQQQQQQVSGWSGQPSAYPAVMPQQWGANPGNNGPSGNTQ